MKFTESEREHLNWIRERYNYLLSAKFDLQEYILKYENDRDVSSPRLKQKATQAEMLDLDDRRTEMYLTKMCIR